MNRQLGRAGRYLGTIRKAAAGQRHIPPEVATRLAGRIPSSQLSPRELDVLRLIVEGKRNKRRSQVRSKSSRGPSRSTTATS